jgi:hypothetical protein
MRNSYMDQGKYGHSVENDKRRRALPIPMIGDVRFFSRLVHVRKQNELVFITKAAAKNR